MRKSPPAVYVENEGGTPPIFQVISPFFLFFVHYFLENVTREPPITPKGGMFLLGLLGVAILAQAILAQEALSSFSAYTAGPRGVACST